MGFKAQDAVEALEFDFNPHVNASGVVPEPTSDQIDEFRTTLAAAYQDLGLDPETLNAATGEGGIGPVLEHFGAIMASTSNLETKVAKAVAVLCSGSPTEEQILALPYRVRQAFLGWMTGTFFNPEA